MNNDRISRLMPSKGKSVRFRNESMRNRDPFLSSFSERFGSPADYTGCSNEDSSKDDDSNATPVPVSPTLPVQKKGKKIQSLSSNIRRRSTKQRQLTGIMWLPPSYSPSRISKKVEHTVVSTKRSTDAKNKVIQLRTSGIEDSSSNIWYSRLSLEIYGILAFVLIFQQLWILRIIPFLLFKPLLSVALRWRKYSKENKKIRKKRPKTLKDRFDTFFEPWQEIVNTLVVRRHGGISHVPGEPRHIAVLKRLLSSGIFRSFLPTMAKTYIRKKSKKINFNYIKDVEEQLQLVFLRHR